MTGNPGTVSPAGSAPALELRDIHKAFGETAAVDGVSIDVRAGEVHAVLGENGAGKSTLMNIAAGFLAPDVGEILVGGQPVQFQGPPQALGAGVAMVHQHYRLVEEFTVAENLAIGAADQGRVTSLAALREHARSLETRYGLRIDPDRRIAELSAGEKQRVEIVRSLSRGAQVLILDEPTAVLTPQEYEQLAETLRSMTAEGRAIVFISHKLNEVLAVADRVSILRSGRLVTTLERRDCTLEILADHMIGKGQERGVPRAQAPHEAGAELLVANGIGARDSDGGWPLRNLAFSVRAYEIVGIVGVAGNGQRELEQIVTGLRHPDEGYVEVAGARPRGVKQFIRAGLAHIPEDRRSMGLIPEESIWLNAAIKRYRKPPIARGPMVRGHKAREYAKELASRVSLSTSRVTTPVGHLSGGNAQKLLTGRELDADPKVVVAVNPTQGLDLGAAINVRSQLAAARDRGLGVLLIAADLDEVLELADRLLVLYEGEIAGETLAIDADRGRIGLLMGGAGRDAGGG